MLPIPRQEPVNFDSEDLGANKNVFDVLAGCSVVNTTTEGLFL
jgi:hypothetical protein